MDVYCTIDTLRSGGCECILYCTVLEVVVVNVYCTILRSVGCECILYYTAKWWL